MTEKSDNPFAKALADAKKVIGDKIDGIKAGVSDALSSATEYSLSAPFKNNKAKIEAADAAIQGGQTVDKIEPAANTPSKYVDPKTGIDFFKR